MKDFHITRKRTYTDTPLSRRACEKLHDFSAQAPRSGPAAIVALGDFIEASGDKKLINEYSAVAIDAVEELGTSNSKAKDKLSHQIMQEWLNDKFGTRAVSIVEGRDDTPGEGVYVSVYVTAIEELAEGIKREKTGRAAANERKKRAANAVA